MLTVLYSISFTSVLFLVFLIQNYFFVAMYRSYVEKFNKSYTDEEYLMRMEYFKDSLKRIKELNNLDGSAEYGLTRFADMSPEEIERMFLPPNQRLLQACVPKELHSCPPPHRRRFSQTVNKLNTEIPAKFDWREKNVVGPVLDQKQCLACWAFSIVGVMESMAAINNMSFQSLSVQELIDCSDMTRGCSGGDVINALNFLCFHNYPIVSADDYPLELITQTCRTTGDLHGIGVAKFTSICDVDSGVILQLVATHGPVIAAVNSRNWLYYIDGVIQAACPGSWDLLQHVVQIVGYDLTAEVPYYIIRNSWGENFGHDGYLKLAIYAGNLCGIESNIVHLDVKKL